MRKQREKEAVRGTGQADRSDRAGGHLSKSPYLGQQSQSDKTSFFFYTSFLQFPHSHSHTPHTLALFPFLEFHNHLFPCSAFSFASFLLGVPFRFPCLSCTFATRVFLQLLHSLSVPEAMSTGHAEPSTASRSLANDTFSYSSPSSTASGKGSSSSMPQPRTSAVPRPRPGELLIYDCRPRATVPDMRPNLAQHPAHPSSPPTPMPAQQHAVFDKEAARDHGAPSPKGKK